MPNNVPTPIPFNPLDAPTVNWITDSLINELTRQPCHAFPADGANMPQFKGSGVYAIYYRGDFSAYRQLAEKNASDCVWPINVGKTIPAGSRKGVSAQKSEDSVSLRTRLLQHLSSFRSARNLAVEHFSYRYLVLTETIITLAEDCLLRYYTPVWNGCLDGFGLHDPGKERYTGMRSAWDEVHPGRKWYPLMQTPNIHPAEVWQSRMAQYIAEVEMGTLKDFTIVDSGDNDTSDVPNGIDEAAG